MSLHTLADLDTYRDSPVPAGYPRNLRTLYAPYDRIEAALLALVRSTRTSLALAMYALTDRLLADAVKTLMADPAVDVQLTFDASQAGLPAETALLAAEQYPATSVAVGQSERGSLMHLKLAVIDGLDVAAGSTNWTKSGEQYQDNQLTVIRNKAVAAEARARVDAIHAAILARQATP